MSKKSSLALIVPCYNEAESIPAFAIELQDFINQFKVSRPEFSLSVIIVDNDSTDNSLFLLKALQEQISELKIHSFSRRGYGAALKYGFGAVDAEYLSFLDLDNTYPLKSLNDLLSGLLERDLDIIYGARIHAASDISVVRSLGNRFYVLLLKFFFKSDLSDVCSGMRLFRGRLKEAVIALKTDDLSFSIDLTALALIKGWKMSEHPIAYRNRTGTSKLSVIRDGWVFLSVIMTNLIRKNSGL